jgi:hypothetical protein
MLGIVVWEKRAAWERQRTGREPTVEPERGGGTIGDVHKGDGAVRNVAKELSDWSHNVLGAPCILHNNSTLFFFHPAGFKPKRVLAPRLLKRLGGSVASRTRMGSS